MQVKAYGVGLKIEGFDDVRVNKSSPRFLESLGIEFKDGKLMVPVAAEVPGFLMGSGVGFGTVMETGDYDIQTTDPKAIEKYDLEKLRLGDVVCLRNQLCINGRGYYKGAVTIGVIIHGSSDFSGHGPGVDPSSVQRTGGSRPKSIPTPTSPSTSGSGTNCDRLRALGHSFFLF